LKRLLERIDREILAAGGKRSRSRTVVIERFFRARNHVTIDQLTHSVREAAPGIGGVTVYRTLKLLERLGYAKELDFGEGARRYESNLSPHHDHLVCRQCGTVIEFEDREIENLQDLVTRRHGFLPTAHRLEIYGFCKKCAPDNAPERLG
jgi:Fur family ferric uptake transcriptional regulator